MERPGLALLNQRARIVRIGALVSLPVMAAATSAAFATGWIGSGSPVQIALGPGPVGAWCVRVGAGLAVAWKSTVTPGGAAWGPEHPPDSGMGRIERRTIWTACS